MEFWHHAESCAVGILTDSDAEELDLNGTLVGEPLEFISEVTFHRLGLEYKINTQVLIKEYKEQHMTESTIHSANKAQLDACKDELSRLHGLAPYNDPSNMSYGDPYFAKDIRKKYPSDILELAKFELGLRAEAPVPVEAVEEPVNPQLVDEEAPVLESDEITELLAEWEASQERLAYWKTEEMRLRKLVAANYFKDPKEGSNKFEDNVRGVKIVADYKVSRSIAKTKLPEVLEQLGELYGEEPLPEFYRNGKPELNLTVYKKLSSEATAIVNDCVTSKMGSPSVKLEKIAEKEE